MDHDRPASDHSREWTLIAVTVLTPAASSLQEADLPSRQTTTTPFRLRAFAAGIVVLALIFALVTVSAVRSLSSGFHQMGDKAAPQVEATSDLYFALNDMDAQLANVLLVGNDQQLGIKQSDALAVYEQRRIQADHDLQQAAAAAGNDLKSQNALNSVLNAFGKYEGLAAQTILLDQRSAHPAGKPPADVLSLYRQATQELRTELLGAVNQLTSDNVGSLNTTYHNQNGSIDSALVSFWLVGGALLAVLGALQFFLVRRFRRRLNPAIAVATAGVLILLITLSTRFSHEADLLNTAKVDAFDSVIAIDKARGVSYDANADESRFLVDPANASYYTVDYLANSEKLLTTGATTLGDYELRLEAATASTDAIPAPRLHGYLGDELANITFPGERDAAIKAINDYTTYQKDDQKLRGYAQSNALRTAILFDTGTTAGQSNADFAAYDNDLVTLHAVNQKYFTQSIHNAESALNGWTLIPPIALLALVAIAGVGLAPRLSEYR